jgi:Tfp pilus assembly protein PilF
MIHLRILAVVISVIGVAGVMLGGCAGGGKGTVETALSAPSKAAPAAAAANEDGIKFFYARQWDAAKAKFEEAIKAQPTLAEAHYNLGLVYDALRNDREARKHFIEASNLAPGNKEIWNAPPFREHGDVRASPKSGDFFTPTSGHH